MAQKKKTKDVTFDTEGRQKELIDKFNYFLRLCQFLLNEDSDDCPFRINEMKETLCNGTKNPFLKQAKDLCEELEISWDGAMSAEDSNRVIINMLGDAFMDLKPSEKEILHVTYKINIELIDKTERKSSKMEGDNGDNS